MMKLKDLFLKSIERSIQGVIVIDEKEEAKVEQELDEFVVTEELEQHLDTFFTAYNHSLETPTDRMGVWISGFFGSGKSHFLKILSYLLDSGMIVGQKRPIDFFEDKLSATEVYAKMEKASQQQNGVILFNIDSKSGSNTKQHKLAVVKVFNKVFNEYRGFSPAVPWMAQLEETLDDNNQLDVFKRVFEEKTGIAWEDGRDEVFYNEDEIVETLMEVTDMSEESARRWITNGENNYDISVESFARRVKKFTDRQSSNFRLIFMADEMGQYISDNKELMLELQTVVEDLGRFTKGKVWVVVTSQQSLINLENDTHSSNDFSKIQGRFATRLSLSSANADEVIKIRLLAKNDTARDTLRIVYDDRMQAKLRNTLSFSENTATLKRFDTADDFHDFYPFVPYQITLLQKVLEEILRYGLAGANVSTGERNLLGTIQAAILQYKDKEIGALIPFHAFYTNLDKSLDYSVRSTVIQANSNNSLTDFDVDILKLLFLIRYLKEVPATVENIATLMLDHIDQDRLILINEIQASLDRLVKEYLIQRSGVEYIFLTNEEQDINREIVNIEVPTANLLNNLGETIFNDILDLKKYTIYPFEKRRSINYTFESSRWIDDRVFGSANAELGVRIITPYSDYYQAADLLLQLSSRENHVIVELDASGTFYDDMLMIMKMEQYFRANSSRSRSDSEQDILNRKSRERTELSKNVQLQLKSALQYAHIYVYGAEVDVKSHSTPHAAIESGLHQLVLNLYPNLSYINKFFQRDDYLDIVRDASDNLLTVEDNDPNQLATDEILRYISRQSDRKITMTLWRIIQEFSSKPFGWRIEDIIVSIIRLILAERVVLKSNRQVIKTNDPLFERQISNRDSQERIVIEKREVLDPRVIRIGKQVVKDIFGQTPIETKEDALMTEIKNMFEKEKTKLKQMLINYQEKYYPGKKDIELYLSDIEKVVRHYNSREFFASLADQAANLSDGHDEILDVRNLFEYSKDSFDEAWRLSKRFVDDQSMIQYDETRTAGASIQAIVKMSRPYTRLKELPELIMQYKDWLNREIDREVEPVMAELKEKREILMQTIHTEVVLEQQYKNIIHRKFMELQQKVEKASTLKDISSAKSEVDYLTDKLSGQINRTQKELAETRRRKLERLAQEQESSINTGVAEPAVSMENVAKQPKPKLMKISEVVDSNRRRIQTEIELDEFIEELYQKLKAELSDDQYIQFI